MRVPPEPSVMSALVRDAERRSFTMSPVVDSRVCRALGAWEEGRIVAALGRMVGVVVGSVGGGGIEGVDMEGA